MIKKEEAIIPPKEEKKPVLETINKEEITIPGNKEVVNQQTQTKPTLSTPPVQKKKEEPRKEVPKKEEIAQEEKSEHEEKPEAQKQNFWTYMSMCQVNMANQNENKNSMMYLIPVFCVDPKTITKEMKIPPIPTVSPIPQMGNMPYFFPYPYGMPMQNK